MGNSVGEQMDETSAASDDCAEALGVSETPTRSGTVVADCGQT